MMNSTFNTALSKLIEKHSTILIPAYDASMPGAGVVIGARFRRGNSADLAAAAPWRRDSTAEPGLTLSDHDRVVLVLERSVRYATETIGIISIAKVSESEGRTRWAVETVDVAPESASRAIASGMLHWACAMVSRASPSAEVVIAASNAGVAALAAPLPFMRTDDGELLRFGNYPISKEFGAVVRRLRTDLGIRQDDLGLLCGVGQSAINMIETGLRLPGPELLRSLLAVVPTSEATRSELLHCLVPGARHARREKDLPVAGLVDESLDCWVLRSIPEDYSDPISFEATCAALRAGRQRIFFHSVSFAVRSVNALRMRFAAAVPGLDSGRLLFSVAPDELVCLQISLFHTGGRVISATIEGSSSRHEPFPLARATDLYAILCEMLPVPSSTVLADPVEQQARRAGEAPTIFVTAHSTSGADGVVAAKRALSVRTVRERQTGEVSTPLRATTMQARALGVSRPDSGRESRPERLWDVFVERREFVVFEALDNYGGGSLLVNGNTVFAFAGPVVPGQQFRVPVALIVANVQDQTSHWTYLGGVEWQVEVPLSVEIAKSWTQ